MIAGMSGRVRLLAAGSVVLVAVLLAGWLVTRAQSGAAAVTVAPSLPRRIGAPAMGTRDALRSPIGPASVVFSSDLWHLDGTVGDSAVTGARSDAYRLISSDFDSTAGLGAILSPDGRRLAVNNAVLDLGTGAVTPLPPGRGADYRVPQAWSPDGRYLATASYTQPDYAPPETYDGQWVAPVTRAVLSVTDTASGQETVLATLPTTAAFDGWVAAFSPDGSRLAYQYGDRIVIAGRGGTAIASLPVPPGTRIAGKGAWTRDGRAVAVVREEACDCGGTYHARWTLSTMDVTSGATVGTGYRLDGVVAVRMVGWTAAGEPAVVRYDPLPPAELGRTAAPVDFRTRTDPSGVDLTGLGLDGIEELSYVASATLVALAPTGPPRTLVAAAPGGAESLDVAEDILATGRDRPGHPPFLTAARVTEAAILAVVGAIGAAIVLAVVLIWRSRRRREPRTV